MAKEKVTLTLDAGRLAELRGRVGSRSVSAAVDAALAAYLDKLRHFAAVDEWLAELDREHGPVPVETLEWAAHLIGDWEVTRRKRVDQVHGIGQGQKRRSSGQRAEVMIVDDESLWQACTGFR